MKRIYNLIEVLNLEVKNMAEKWEFGLRKF